MKNFLYTLIFIIFCGSLLTLSLRGIPGNPNESIIGTAQWKEEGPLELSPDRGRFALTYSVVENNSVHYSLALARFIVPDLGYKDGKYVSLFAPGVSYMVIPGYLIGKNFDLAQVGTFAVISLFALLNALLIRQIAIQIGVNKIISTIASLVFLFATPAFTYAVTLYQHHISTFLILSSIYLLIRFKGIWPLLGIWFNIALSLSIDYPNFFLLAPIGIFAFGRIISLETLETKYKIRLRLMGLLTGMSVILPLLFFFWFNQTSYGSPFQLAGTVPGVKAIDEKGKPTLPKNAGTEDLTKFIDPDKQEKTAVGFFQTRNLFNGFYTHLVSPDRGIVVFTPVILFGLLGIYFLSKENGKLATLLMSLLGVNFLLYSLWGDPWGGWAFGSRYLVPSFAILAILLAVTLSKLKRNKIFLPIFIILLIYSIWVNTLGAITSSANPPKVESLGLEKQSGHQERYSYDRNVEFLNNNRSKSYLFQAFLSKYLTAWQFYLLLCTLIAVPLLVMILSQAFRKDLRNV